MADLRSVMQATIDRFVENNTQAVKQKEEKLLSAALASNCIRMYRPLSFSQRYPQFFKPQISNAEYEAQMRHELQTMQDVSQSVTRTVIDTVGLKASIGIEKTVFTTDAKTIVEVILDLDFTEDGKQITQVMEFVDTYQSTKVLEEILGNMASAQ
ncbi:hypothetical protein F5Y16DRAFT_121992 [Xylariaceae sp. FL0255]|nr:hypothetical protein F5Y16DRAFT_121992 [Xylariaceae sp. FL0255]